MYFKVFHHQEELTYIADTPGKEINKGHGLWSGAGYNFVFFDPAQVDIVPDVSAFEQMPLVPTSLFGMDKLVSINGGGFDEYDTFGIPRGLCAAYGKVYCSKTGEQSLYINRDGSISWTKPAQIYHAINYPNRLITSGVKRTDLDNTIKDRRTLVGTKGRMMYWIVTEPMTKADAASLCAMLGLYDAANFDGGQSSEMNVDGVPMDGYHGRPVVTHLGLVRKGSINLYRALTGDQRPDIGWLGRPYGTFDNIPLLENPILQKGAGIEVTQHWPQILKLNQDSNGFTQAQKEAWLVSNQDSTDMPISYDEITGKYKQHTPEVAGGALVNVLEVSGTFAKIQCFDVTNPLPTYLPNHLIYTWTALTPPKTGYPTGQSYYPRGGVRFPILYWRNYAYVPLEWLVKI